MRTVRTKVYQFSELSEQAKENAINWYRSCNNDNYAWDDTKEDAKEIGLKLIQLSDHKKNEGEFIEDAHYCANRTIEAHGDICDTHKTAKTFWDNWNALVAKHSDGIELNKVTADNSNEFDEDANELEEQFLQDILEDYRIIYNKDNQYRDSDEYIAETIEANEYEFTQDGNRF